jgi:tetratricopeptide (TPR) repeat protein
MTDMPTADSRIYLTIISIWVLVLFVGVAGPPRAGAAESVITADTAADSSRKYRYLAKTARERKEHDKALEYYRRLLLYDPDYAAAHYFRGKILVEQKNFSGAKECLLAAIGLDSLLVNGNALLCQLYLNEDKPDSSQLYVNRIRDLKAGRFRPLQRRIADALRRAGLTRAAIAQYENLAAADSSSTGELYALLATLHQDIGESREALSWRTRLLSHQEKMAPGSPEVRIETLQEMVLLQEKTGAYDDALATLDQLAQMDSGNGYPYYSQMADIAEKTSRPAIKRAALEGMAMANPKDVESVAALAELFVAEGELGAAEEWIAKGLVVVPADAHLQVLNGDIMSRKGLEEQAIAAFEIALGDPDWRGVAQQRIWQLRPPETEEEKLKRAFFGETGSDPSPPEQKQSH